MKLEIEVYDIGELLYHMKENRIEEFRPYKLEIVSEYNGYTGDHWGDTQSSGNKGGYPITIKYTDVRQDPKVSNVHTNLFRTKEELVEHLMKKK
jgi:hypothetical protein